MANAFQSFSQWYLPNKFEFILFGRNVYPVTESLSFSDVTIQCATEVKLLGLSIRP